MSDVHVMPADDLIDHAFVDCPCAPRTEAVFREDGSNGWLHVHNSLDGREAMETQHGRLVEQGRQLANERDDLIAAGVNPKDLAIPLMPEPTD